MEFFDSLVGAAQLPKQAAGIAVSKRMHNPVTTNVLILDRRPGGKVNE